ncbi:hypothetical protein ACTWQL_15980 [Pseudalkalibacillus sp. R45]|uniref:hypothetical protein n=1 Tax=Pseudalkalibacillus sp. R45 TaxID=3457433 RepID=UPI003FCCCD50
MESTESKLACESYEGTWTTMAFAIHRATKSKTKLSLVELMGYTGYAFRLNVNEEKVDVAGPTAFDWDAYNKKALGNIGVRFESYGTSDFTPPTPDELTLAISKIQESIDKEQPVIAWDLFLPEFGIIYGYDDDKKELYAMDGTGKHGPIAYEKLGNGELKELFIMTITNYFEVSKVKRLKGALDIILTHALEEEEGCPVPMKFQNGLKGYDAWVKAFKKGEVHPFGNAYNIAVLYDARRFAAKFLKDVRSEWQDENDAVASYAGIASDHYEDVAQQLLEFRNIFPFPVGGEPNEPANRERAIGLLKKAKESERLGIEALQKMYAELD